MVSISDRQISEQLGTTKLEFAVTGLSSVDGVPKTSHSKSFRRDRRSVRLRANRFDYITMTWGLHAGNDLASADVGTGSSTIGAWAYKEGDYQTHGRNMEAVVPASGLYLVVLIWQIPVSITCCLCSWADKFCNADFSLLLRSIPQYQILYVHLGPV